VATNAIWLMASFSKELRHTQIGPGEGKKRETLQSVITLSTIRDAITFRENKVQLSLCLN